MYIYLYKYIYILYRFIYIYIYIYDCLSIKGHKQEFSAIFALLHFFTTLYLFKIKYKYEIITNMYNDKQCYSFNRIYKRPN